MSYTAEKIAISKFFQEHPLYSQIGTCGFENLPNPSQKNEIFTYMEILNFSSFQVSMGGVQNNLFRYIGAVQFTVYGISEKGVLDALAIADKLASMFRNQNIVISSNEVIKFESPSISRGREQSGRFPIFVRCPFYRNEYQ